MQFVEAHGARIPIVGFGSMRLKEDAGASAIEAAIRQGYRHVDTAAFYGNEREVGQATKASGVKREDIFLTTKVRDNNLKADDFARSLDNSLKLLDLPAVDLLLIHWPNPQVPAAEASARSTRPSATASPGISACATTRSRCCRRRRR